MESIGVIVHKLIWDEWNHNHIQGHDVTSEEVELALRDRHVVFLRAHSGRIMVLGRVSERLLAIVMNEQEDRGVFYVITARDMSKKERNFYRSQKGKSDEYE